MADFCFQCTAALGGTGSDFAGLLTRGAGMDGESVVVLCEGCGPIEVDPEGRCVSEDCPKHGSVQAP